MRRGLLGRRHPEPVLGFDCDLSSHERAAVTLGRRQPGRGVGVTLASVGGPVDGQQVQRVVSEPGTHRSAPLSRALLPGVGQRDHVVDLYGGRCSWSANEADRLAGVGIAQGAPQDQAAAGAGLQHVPGQVATQDVVAGVAAVTVQVSPGRPERSPVIARLGCPALHRESTECGQRRSRVSRRRGRRYWCRNREGRAHPGLGSGLARTHRAAGDEQRQRHG